MTVQNEEIRERLHFIDRTIIHALQACHSDASVPMELKDYVCLLGHQSSHAQQALQSSDERSIRESIANLARTSYFAQNAIRSAEGMNYAVKCAVILTHIELSALHHQLN